MLSNCYGNSPAIPPVQEETRRYQSKQIKLKKSALQNARSTLPCRMSSSFTKPAPRFLNSIHRRSQSPPVRSPSPILGDINQSMPHFPFSNKKQAGAGGRACTNCPLSASTLCTAQQRCMQGTAVRTYFLPEPLSLQWN